MTLLIITLIIILVLTHVKAWRFGYQSCDKHWEPIGKILTENSVEALMDKAKLLCKCRALEKDCESVRAENKMLKDELRELVRADPESIYKTRKKRRSRSKWKPCAKAWYRYVGPQTPYRPEIVQPGDEGVSVAVMIDGTLKVRFAERRKAPVAVSPSLLELVDTSVVN